MRASAECRPKLLLLSKRTRLFVLFDLPLDICQETQPSAQSMWSQIRRTTLAKYACQTSELIALRLPVRLAPKWPKNISNVSVQRPSPPFATCPPT